jgi:hypothetical protein
MDASRAARPWFHDHELWIELFVLANFAGLILDIFLAHSENQFRRESEYVPLVFSAVATVMLACVIPLRRKWPIVWRDVGHLVEVGRARDRPRRRDSASRQPVLLRPHDSQSHLCGRRLPRRSPLRVLACCCSSTGSSNPTSLERAQWVLLLGLGGFIGNFVFSLTDHAQNAFFNPLEWIRRQQRAGHRIPAVPFVMRITTPHLWLCGSVLSSQARPSASQDSRCTRSRIGDGRG